MDRRLFVTKENAKINVCKADRKSVITAALLTSLLSAFSNVQAKVNCEEVVDELSKYAKAGGALIVDVRSEDEFVNGHFPAAIHIAPEVLPNKRIFRDYQIVLIDLPFRKQKNDLLCKFMLEKGFGSVYFGGQAFLRWAKANRMMAILDAAYTLDINDFVVHGGAEEFTAIVKEPDPVLAKYFPHRREIPQLTGGAVRKMLSLSSSENFVVVDDDFSMTSELMAYNLDHENQVYVLRGGVSALKMFDRMRKAIAGKHAFRLQEVQGCSN